MNTVFIHTNNKQLLGARIAKFALEKHRKRRDAFTVEILNVDELSIFKDFAGTRYLRGGEECVFDHNDLQSFTLSRFMAPELMGYRGRSALIDPDIFALADITELFEKNFDGNILAACRKKDAWDSSVMLMDNTNLTHWNIREFLEQLSQKRVDYLDLMQLRLEKQDSILELPRIWNSLDSLTSDTKMLHTTNRLTQPWKTGLLIDFVLNPNPLPKILGLIPRELIIKLLGRIPKYYKQHPNKNIEEFFFTLAKEALAAGAITPTDIEREIRGGKIRSDFIERLDNV